MDSVYIRNITRSITVALTMILAIPLVVPLTILIAAWTIIDHALREGGPTK